jgi:hypothetical protein
MKVVVSWVKKCGCVAAYNEHRGNNKELREHICLRESLNYDGMCSSEV